MFSALSRRINPLVAAPSKQASLRRTRLASHTHRAIHASSSMTQQKYKEIREILGAPPRHWVGNGFHVFPVFHNKAFTKELSPWLMFDYAAPKQFEPSYERRGVGQHPHRGFETITIAWQGEVEHGDSVGNRDVIGDLWSICDLDEIVAWRLVFGDVCRDIKVNKHSRPTDSLTHQSVRELVYFSPDKDMSKGVGVETLLHHFAINGWFDPFSNCKVTWKSILDINPMLRRSPYNPP